LSAYDAAIADVAINAVDELEAQFKRASNEALAAFG
jgi:hypothetical protein